jgi:hypothetical protein
MEFEYGSTPRFLVQAIDILRNDQNNVAQALELGQSMMAAARGRQTEGGPAHEAPCPVPPTRALGPQKVMMVDGLGALPSAIPLSIVRGSARCAQPRTGENNNGTVVEETSYQITGSVKFCSDCGHGV